ncbi:hypothetical protein Y032_0034g2935 [Ancylostoma ceylanicum]|uniref:Serpentine receptor class gamma n=2 Tax=Ancylostoma ceylanicum TaxID=53326 RepID=A0A016UMA4_9BILA|nr:hypothetical protein Y032_0034g2935 [Ancylostoma ceylanicum]
MSSPDISLPLQLFVGTARTYTSLWYIFISTSSIFLHTMFILGTRKLCGWKSNFSFLLLIIVSTLSILRFIIELIAGITAFFYMDWMKYQILWIGLGSLARAPYFGLIMVNISMSIHRISYTALPIKAVNYFNKTILKIILVAILVFFLTFAVMLNTALTGIIWVDSLMTYTIINNHNHDTLVLLNSICNYAVGLINFVAYSLMFALLFRRRLISFKHNRELKMTLQASCMVACEMMFFLYWEFTHLGQDNVVDILVSETTELLFFDILILPYLIFNRNIHSQLKAIMPSNSTHAFSPSIRVISHIS